MMMTPVLGVEPVHLDEQRVECLLTFVVATAHTVATVAANGVDFIDEDQARREFLLPLLEHVAHAAGADADEHLDEVRTADAEERHVRLAGDGAREQRLAGAGGADHEDALRDAPAEALELLRVFEELDDLPNFLLRLVDTGDVFESDFVLLQLHRLGLALAEAHRAALGHLHLLAEEEVEDQQDEEDRQQADQHCAERVVLVGGGGDNLLAGHFVVGVLLLGEHLLQFLLLELEVDAGAEFLRLAGFLVGHPADDEFLAAAGSGLDHQVALDAIVDDAALLVHLGHHLAEFRERDDLAGTVFPAPGEGDGDQHDGHRQEDQPAPVDVALGRLLVITSLRRSRVVWHGLVL